jgi:hypothetical protein
MSDFKRVFSVDDPAMQGAQWWQDSVDGNAGLTRRTTLIAVGVGVGTYLAYRAIDVIASADVPETTRLETALSMQRRFGWSFGAHGSPLRTLPFAAAGIADAKTVGQLDLPPAEGWLRPFYAGVLAEAPTAIPTESSNEGTEPQALAGLIPAIVLDGMDSAFRVGAWFPEHLPGVGDAALIVDLAGVESVAFAAGACGAYSPVFCFGNWPHPNGVVDAHGVLAALAYFQPLFQSSTQTVQALGGKRSPLFCLDGQRLAPYDGDTLTFDNRYRVTLPTAEILKKNGIRTVVHVVANAAEPVREDLVDPFAAYAAAGLVVRRVATAEFLPPANELKLTKIAQFAIAALEASAKKPKVFGGFADFYRRFSLAYPDVIPPAADSLGALRHGGAPVEKLADAPFGSAYTWRPLAKPLATPPAQIGLVPVVLVGAVVVGAEMARRRGTWTRASGGWGG